MFSIIVISLIKILATCLPTGPVEWLMRKFATHSKLTADTATVTFAGQTLEGADKAQVIAEFNEAIFIKKHYIFPGTEDSFLHPDSSEPPLVIDTNSGKKKLRLYVYRYEDRAEVVKQFEKKVVAYACFPMTAKKERKTAY